MNSCVEGSNPSFSVPGSAAAPIRRFAGETSRFPPNPLPPVRYADGRCAPVRIPPSPLKRLAALASFVAFAVGCGGDEGPHLEGPFWVLESGRDVPLEPGITATASFREGTVRGYTGCNQYTASYTAEGDSLEIGAVGSTLMACPPPRDAIEQAYVAALDQVASWTTDGEELVLSDGGGEELLRYTQARTGGDI